MEVGVIFRLTSEESPRFGVARCELRVRTSRVATGRNVGPQTAILWASSDLSRDGLLGGVRVRSLRLLVGAALFAHYCYFWWRVARVGWHGIDRLPLLSCLTSLSLAHPDFALF